VCLLYAPAAFRHIIYRGTPGPLDTSSVTSMDVYVLYQPGPFSVTLRRIVAVENSADPDTVPLMDMSNAQVEALIKSTLERGSIAYNKDQIEVCGEGRLRTGAYTERERERERDRE